MKGCEDQLVTSHRANLDVMNLNFEREEIVRVIWWSLKRGITQKPRKGKV